jgi:predicted metal-dependent enzyme (double-stranded beta helix superfamily)
MTYTLDAFCKDCQSVLKADKGPGGREKIRGLIEKLLTNKEFVAEHLGPQVATGRTTLYEDPELKFCVLAHVDRGGRSSTPHDHGRSWAVYGQAVGWSDMSIWKRKDGGAGAGPAELVKIDTFRLDPGKAGIFDIGAIHGVDRSPGDCTFLRVTGEDLEVVPRLKYDLDAKRAITIESAGVTA